MLKERLPKEVRLNGTCSSGADDDRNDRVLLRVVICLVLSHALSSLCEQGESRRWRCSRSEWHVELLKDWVLLRVTGSEGAAGVEGLEAQETAVSSFSLSLLHTRCDLSTSSAL